LPFGALIRPKVARKVGVYRFGCLNFLKRGTPIPNPVGLILKPNPKPGGGVLLGL